MVSTWFANARRRLKKENKMTWSPRNRPGEDDDDESGDAGAPVERDLSDRPSSSASDGGITVAVNNSSPQDNVHSKSATPPTRAGITESNPSTSSAAIPTAISQRKSKIWSIAETLSNRAVEANRSSSNSKDDRDRASTSAGDGKSSDDGRESIPSMLDASSAILPPFSGHPSLLPPVGVQAVPAANGQISQNFLHFNPWQQQQLAMTMAARLPFPRPEVLAMMAQAGHLRQPIFYSPMFMGAGIPGVPPQQPPFSLSSTTPLVSSSPSTSHSNGMTSKPIRQMLHHTPARRTAFMPQIKFFHILLMTAVTMVMMIIVMALALDVDDFDGDVDEDSGNDNGVVDISIISVICYVYYAFLLYFFSSLVDLVSVVVFAAKMWHRGLETKLQDTDG
ncbi:unnamed protein product [Gongylonema pulchrum]|uniref:Homeobox domain-containing protein n=1 Tax=Gongylonema pulchrum TaxID=637853 RepID=A0A183CU84_9BILA|nr:unnamed protein product [Gongylonema pulchrum]